MHGCATQGAMHRLPAVSTSHGPTKPFIRSGWVIEACFSCDRPSDLQSHHHTCLHLWGQPLHRAGALVTFALHDPSLHDPYVWAHRWSSLRWLPEAPPRTSRRVPIQAALTARTRATAGAQAAPAHLMGQTQTSPTQPLSKPRQQRQQQGVRMMARWDSILLRISSLLSRTENQMLQAWRRGRRAQRQSHRGRRTPRDRLRSQVLSWW